MESGDLDKLRQETELLKESVREYKAKCAIQEAQTKRWEREAEEAHVATTALNGKLADAEKEMTKVRREMKVLDDNFEHIKRENTTLLAAQEKWKQEVEEGKKVVETQQKNLDHLEESLEKLIESCYNVAEKVTVIRKSQ